MRIIGIDPSYTSTGVAVIHAGVLENYYNIKTSAADSEAHRLSYIYNTILQGLRDVEDKIVVCIEAPAHAAKFAAFKTISPNALCRLACSQLKIQYLEMPPTSLKKVFAGSGKASKRDMQAKVLEVYGVKVNNDIADATGLATCLYDFLSACGMVDQQQFSNWYKSYGKK